MADLDVKQFFLKTFNYDIREKFLCSRLRGKSIEVSVTRLDGLSKTLLYYLNGKKRRILAPKGGGHCPTITNDFVDSENYVVLCEGEPDLIAMNRLTSQVISIGGQNQWKGCIDLVLDRLRGMKNLERIHIVFDNENEAKYQMLQFKDALSKKIDIEINTFNWPQLDLIKYYNDIRDYLITSESCHMNEWSDLSRLFRSEEGNDDLAELDLISEADHQIKIKFPLDHQIIGNKPTLFIAAELGSQTMYFSSNGDSIKAKKNIRDLGNFLTPIEFIPLKIPLECKEYLRGRGYKTDFVFKELRDLLVEMYDFNELEEELDLVTLYIMMTYLWVIFEHIPFLFFNGEAASGKSKLMKILSTLAFNSNNTTNPTPASVRRTIPESRGLYCLDDMEVLANLNSRNKEFISHVCSSYDRDAITTLTINEKVEKLQLACPKIINNIDGLPHTLLTRFLRIQLKKKDRVSPNKRIVELNKEIEVMRTILTSWSLKNHSRVYENYISLSRKYNQSRETDLRLPIDSIILSIEDCSLRASVSQSSQSYFVRNTAYSNFCSGIYKDLKKVFTFMLEDKKQCHYLETTSSEIYDYLNNHDLKQGYSKEELGKTLRHIGFQTKRRRPKSGKSYTVYKITLDKLQKFLKEEV